MLGNYKSPESKSNNNKESPNYNLRHVNSSEGPRSKMDYNKSSSRNNLVNDQSSSDLNNFGPEGSRQSSAHSPPQYRITSGPLRSAGPKLKGSENKNNFEEIRGPSGEAKNFEYSGAKSGGPKYLAKGKEKLYEEWLDLKKHVNVFQEENTKLKTRNSQLEKEAIKFEKILQEVAVNPRKQKQLLKAEEGNAPNLKQHMKELKNDLDDRVSELKSLKKKAKVTKVNELEVQIQSFQDEIVRLKALTEHVIAKKTEKIMQEGEKRLVQAQNAECERLRRQIEMLQSVNVKQEQICKDYETQVTSKDAQYKKENAQTNQEIQAKEKEISQLRTQVAGFTAATTSNTNKKSQPNAAAEAKIRKELETVALENHDLKVNIEDRNERISELQRRIKEAETRAEEAQKAEANRVKEEAEIRKTLQNPSYPPQVIAKEEKKDTPQPVVAQPKENKPVQPAVPKVEEKKVSSDEAKKIGYHINLSFRAKGVPFEAIEKLDWKKHTQNGSISRDQIASILHTNIFGLSEKEITVLTQYLLQENHGKENKTNNVEGVKNTLTNLIGPLPHWDEDTKKKLHHSISKICTEYRETFSEALDLTCNGGNLTRKGLEEAAKAIDVSLNFGQLEYIVTKLYERSNDPDKLSRNALFEIFAIEPSEKSTPRVPHDDDHEAPASSARSRKSDSKPAVKSGTETKPSEPKSMKPNDKIDQHQKQSGRTSKETEAEAKEKSRKGSPNSRRDSKGESDAVSKLDNADKIYGADSDLNEDEQEEIYNDEFEGEPNKLSDEEDPDGEPYEYLFQPDDKKNSARITERGEEEEDDAEEDKHQESDRHKPKETKINEEKPDSKRKQETEEENYQDEEYEEEVEEDEADVKPKEKEERKSLAESGPKSGRTEPVKSHTTTEPLASNRSDQNQKQTISPRPESKQSGKRVKLAEKEPSEENETKPVKSRESLEEKEKTNVKKAAAAPEDNYEEEFDAEFPEEEF